MSEQPIITRAEAKAAGLKRFFTGVPCVHGHLAERYTTARACVECLNIRSNERYRADPEASKQHTYAWRLANPERFRELHNASVRRWRAADPERCKEQRRAHDQKYREKQRRKREALASGAGA